MTIFALLGAGALWLLYGWLLSAIVAGYLAHRKGYNETHGIASGLLLFAIAPIVWLFVPAKPESLWKSQGPLPPRSRGRST